MSLRISACVFDQGRLRGQTEEPMQLNLFPVRRCGGTRRDMVSLQPHFKLTLRLWPALNTADNADFIAHGWWQTGANCHYCHRTGLGVWGDTFLRWDPPDKSCTRLSRTGGPTVVIQIRVPNERGLIRQDGSLALNRKWRLSCKLQDVSGEVKGEKTLNFKCLMMEQWTFLFLESSQQCIEPWNKPSPVKKGMKWNCLSYIHECSFPVGI